MYAEITKIDPSFQQTYALKDFLRDISPRNSQPQIDRLVNEILIAKSQENFVLGTLNDPSALLETLNKIFYEDHKYFEFLIEFIGEH